MELFKKSIAAGVLIGIGCTIYLSMDNKVVGAALFSIGLFVICSFGMYLFTGKIGYVLQTKNNPNCLFIWLGNFLGSVIVSIAVRIAKPQLHIAALNLLSSKLQQSLLADALLALLCGCLMFLAVENFNRRPHTFSGIIGIFLCVMAFILCGFEHSVANMSYCALAVESLRQAAASLWFLLLVSVFNGIGALAMKMLTTSRTSVKGETPPAK